MMMEDVVVKFRYLQDSSSGGEDEQPLSSSQILRATCKIYGSIFLVLFVLYLFVRGKYPHIFNIKRYHDNLKVPIADNPFGFLSWMWNVFKIPYHDIVEHCGMDAGK
jgi:hypothetical protein